MGNIKISVRTNITEELARKLAKRANAAEETLAQVVSKDTAPFVPMRTGSLDERTRVVGNTVIYPGPYARYLYYGKVMVNAATGKGPKVFIAKDGTRIARFPKGSKLKATGRDLKISTSKHKHAQSHWFEASKAQNLEKWKRAVAKAVTEGK